MIDYLALGLTHALILLALLRILPRDALDREDTLADAVSEPAKTTKREARQARRGRRSNGDA